MPASVCPAEDRVLPNATGHPSAARPCHARPPQQPFVAQAKTRAPKPRSTILPPVFCFGARIVFPFHFCTNFNDLTSLSINGNDNVIRVVVHIGTACFTPGGRRSSQRHRAAEAWTGPNRWREGRECGVARKRVARVSQQNSRGAPCAFCTIRSCLCCLRGNTICQISRSLQS